MAAPNSSWNEVTTTALHYRAPKMFDNVSKQIAIVNRLKAKGKLKIVDGGEDIIIPLEYAENSTYKRYSGYETLNIAPSEVFSAAEYEWKQIAIAVTISGLEQLQNSGRTRKFDLLKSRIANAERTFLNNFATDLYSDGTASGGKQIGGLQSLVADSPSSGTVGGINRATYTWWRNYSSNITMTAANAQSSMNTAWLETCRTGDRTDLILCDDSTYKAYWESLQAIQRIEKTSMATAGFEALKYKNADVVFDGGTTSGFGGACPANHMYFLNTDYLFLCVHKDRNMKPLDPDRYAVNQDALVKLVGFAGNLCLANGFVQGVLY